VNAGGIIGTLSRLPAAAVIFLVRLYQVTLSAVLGGQCRFVPTCSWYVTEALQKHGLLVGGWMGLRRLLRCHPFSRGGYDPVR
jgi:putative membrane protein insertion efficiency factor